MNSYYSKNSIRIIRMFAGLLAVFAAAGARAQGYGGGGDIQQTVARVSFLSGDVSYNRGDEPDVWQDAALNVPMTLGDRLYLRGDGRAMLQLQGRNFVGLGADSDFSVLNLTDDVEQFSLQSGTASFRVSRLGDQDSFEVDTPNVAVTFERAGDYRLDVDQDGNTRVIVRSGQALVAAGGGQVPLSPGTEMDITGIDSPEYEIVALPGRDAWDRWVDARTLRLPRSRSYGYVNAGVVGVDDLDRYGQWSDIPQYGHVWSPVSVEVGWQPYRAGRWCWQDPWGWTWIADEPWGWAPYHYGRWVTYSSRWFWVPVAPRAAYPRYSPALVAFVGGGSGWSASFSLGGGGYVGWFPLAPRDPFIPWWGSQARVSVNVVNVNYVNRNYVTVVNHNTFVSGGGVASNVIRDTAVVRQVVAAPVLRGALPVMPAVGSLRVSARAGAAARPPAQVSARAVVTRLAPPAIPPSFQSKVTAIREQRGAPVTASAAARISIQDNQGARSLQPVRPAAAAEGSVTLRSRGAGASTPRPEAVTAPRGRALATRERPVVSTPAAAANPGADIPARIAPNAVDSPRGRGQAPTDRPQPRTVAPPAENTPPPERQREVVVPPVEKSREAPPERPRPRTFAPPAENTPPPERQREVVAPPAEKTPPPERQRQVVAPPDEKRGGGPPPERLKANPRGTEARPDSTPDRSVSPKDSGKGGKKPLSKKPAKKNKDTETPPATSEAPPRTQ